MGDDVTTEGANMARWRAATGRTRHIVCLGDSITYDRAMQAAGIERNWVEQLAQAFDARLGPRRGDGFRGLWRSEWKLHGDWTQTLPSDAFDVSPFCQGFYTSNRNIDVATWRKPRALKVDAFDLYWFQLPGMGGWQYRVDDDEWCTVTAPTGVDEFRLHRVSVVRCVQRCVMVRGFDGSKPSLASVAGINVSRRTPAAAGGTVVHNLGNQKQFLSAFCRQSAGDPLALLDDLRPDLLTVLFSNDVRFKDPARFGQTLERLVDRVRHFADVLLIAPYEQRPRSETITADDPVATRTAVTTSGSAIIRTPKRDFAGSDVGAPIAGTNIPEGATVASLQSRYQITITKAATGSTDRGELIIVRGRDARVQAEYRLVTKDVARMKGCAFIDLHEEWAKDYGEGWTAANGAGLMQDPLHPNQRGHDDIAERVKALLI